VPIEYRKRWLRVYMLGHKGGVGVPDVDLTADATFVGAAWLAVPQLRRMFANCPGVAVTAGTEPYLLPGYGLAISRLADGSVPPKTLAGLSLQAILNATPTAGLQATLSLPLYARAMEMRVCGCEQHRPSSHRVRAEQRRLGMGDSAAVRSPLPHGRRHLDSGTAILPEVELLDPDAAIPGERRGARDKALPHRRGRRVLRHRLTMPCSAADTTRQNMASPPWRERVTHCICSGL
jgi:hypothetical protein